MLIDSDKNLPAKVEFQGKKISAIACGSQSSFAITESGELFSWGSANKGALGHEEYLDEESPKFVRSLVGKLRVVQISCGEAHALAVTQSGPYSWGWNSCGQLGLGHVNDCSVPQQIEALKGMEIMSISCGAAHSCAVVCKIVELFCLEFLMHL
jgi:alpha-tubulin suppressor-like RCC1 family protein